MGWFSKSSTVLKIAVACLCVVYILVIVGFATPHWSIVTRKISYSIGQIIFTYKAGLWKECLCADSCACSGRQNTPDWFKATQALMTLAVITLSIALILSFLLLCVIRNRKLKIANIALIAVSGIFIIVAVILYGTKNDKFNYKVPTILQSLIEVDNDHDYGYSYILCYVAVAILFLICVSLFVWDIRIPIRDREVHVHHYRREPYTEVYERRERPQYLHAPPSYALSSYAPPSYHSNSNYKPRSQVSYIEPYGQSHYGMERSSHKPRDEWSFNVLSDRASKRY